MNQDLTLRVVNTAERIENADGPEDIDVLDVKVECQLDGTLSGITCVLCTGGPHIEVDLWSHSVTGWWGSESHTVPVFENEEVLDALAERYEAQWETNF